MGQFHFLVPERERVSPAALQTAYICGRDHLPFVSRVAFGADGELVVDRDETESGTFNILWPLADRGQLILSTATLMEREQPYQLPLELARGTLNRLRNLASDWQSSGMTVTEQVEKDLEESLKCFVQAVAQQPTPLTSAQCAERSIVAALAALDGLSADVVKHVADIRRQQTSRIYPLFAGRLGDSVPESATAAAFSAAFNTAVAPFSWSQIEADEGRQNWSRADVQVQWCQTRGLRICGGPLIELRRRSLPDWLYLWEGDFENLLMVAGDFIRAVVQRYRGKIHFWNAAGRLITGDALGLDLEQKLRLAARSVEVIRAADSQSPVIVSFDQPWAESMARRDSDLSPLQFADALVRSDLGISGVGLEINLGTTAYATLPRDLFEFAAQLDAWATMGLPLLVFLAVPSAEDDFTAQRQLQWLEAYLPLILARPTVQAIIWNQLLDADADDFPNAGLVDAQGQIKPAFSALATLRKQFSA